MQLFEGYNAEELHRLLNASRWIAGLLLLLTVAVFAFNQWLGARTSTAQQTERSEAIKKLAAAEEELQRQRARASDVASSFDRLTTPRKLTPAQIQQFPTAVALDGSGRVIVTYLTVEWDAEDYARQLGHVLRSAGLNVVVSDHLWVELKENGVFLTGLSDHLSSTGSAVQRAFDAVGIRIPVIASPDTAKAVGARAEDAVLVVSNRN